jgi:SpoVK/Ycf46/Vps4 family AAA+-type ATPase
MFDELEAMAPAILILDEIHYLMSAASSDADGGTAERVRSIMLEKTSALMKSNRDVLLVGATNKYDYLLEKL